MERRRFLLMMPAAAVTAPFPRPLAACAQGPSSQRKARLIGVLHPGVPDENVPALVALRPRLRTLGWVENQSIVIDYRWAGGRLETLPEIAQELARRNVDLIYAIGPQAIRAARQASRSIPIVGTDLGGDPIEHRLAATFARPGGNLTGLFLDRPRLTRPPSTDHRMLAVTPRAACGTGLP